MHNTISYKDRLTPKFDAVEDIKKWLGRKKWDKVSPDMAKIIDPRHFGFLAGIAGVQGFPVEAWYDLYHGEGSFLEAWKTIEETEEEFEVSDEH